MKKLIFLLLLLFPNLAFAQNATTIGTLTLTPTFDNIGVVLSYTGDANSNNSATIQYRRQGASTWLNNHISVVSTVASWPDRRSTSGGISNTANQNQFRTSILGLYAGYTYEFQITLTDADGVTGTNPVTGNTTILDPTTYAVQSGSTKYLDTTAAGGGDGSSGTPYNTWANAQTGTSCGDHLIIKATSGASAGVTFSKSCTSTTWYIVECADQSVTTFSEGSGTTPNLTVSGDFVKITNCKFGASSDDNISLTSSPTSVWFDGIITVDSLTTAASAECSTSRLYEAPIEIAAGSTNIIVTNSTISELGTHAPCASDHSESSGRAIMFNGASTGGLHIIKGNTFTGGWADCIGNSPENQTNKLDNSDILNNTFTTGSCNDDTIQFEASDINTRIGGNNIVVSSVGYACIALQTGFYGPIYVYRNYCSYAGPSYAYKIGGTENIYWFHNTVKTTTGSDCWAESAGSTTQIYISARNNICQTQSGNPLYKIYSTGTTYNYDTYYKVSGGNVVDSWNGSTNYATVALFCSGASQECQGVSGNPTLDASLHISNTSNSYNVGLTIPNINDADSCWPYANSTPDIGAYEVNGIVGPACSSVAANAPRRIRVIRLGFLLPLLFPTYLLHKNKTDCYKVVDF